MGCFWTPVTLGAGVAPVMEVFGEGKQSVIPRCGFSRRTGTISGGGGWPRYHASMCPTQGTFPILLFPRSPGFVDPARVDGFSSN